jgi:hypothetical protein
MTQQPKESSQGERALNAYGRSLADELKAAQGKGNEDFVYPPAPADMRRSTVFVVGDFMATTFPNIGEQAVASIDGILRRVSKLPPRYLLSQLANDLDKAMKNAAQGRHVVEFTMAAGVIDDRYLLYYITIGDCGINVYREGRLHLLNGSNFHVSSMTVEATDEIKRVAQSAPWPPSRGQKCGRGTTYVQPREVELFQLERDDLVLFFSDGVERNLTPVDRLKLIEEAKSQGGDRFPELLVTRTLSEAQQRGGGDDCTLLALAGPFVRVPSEEVERMKSELREDLTRIEGFLAISNTTLRNLQTDAVSRSQLEGVSRTLAELREALRKLDGVPEWLGNLTQSVNQIGPKVERAGQAIERLTGDQPTLEKIRGEVRGLLSEKPFITKGDVRTELQLQAVELTRLLTNFKEEIMSGRGEREEAPASAQELKAVRTTLEGLSARLDRLDDLASKSDIEALRTAAELTARTQQSADGNAFRGSTPPQGAVAPAAVPLGRNDRTEAALEETAPPVSVLAAAAASAASATSANGEGKSPDTRAESADDAKAVAATLASTNGTQSRTFFEKLTGDRRFRFVSYGFQALLVVSFAIFTVSLLNNDTTHSGNEDGSNVNVNTSANTNTNVNAGIVGGSETAGNVYRADLLSNGWTLKITGPNKDESFPKLFIRPPFSNREVTQWTFNSKQELLTWEKESRVFSKADELKKELQKDEPFMSINNLIAYPISTTDVTNSQSNGGNVCAVVALYKKVGMEDLEKLNGNLKCSELQAGDILFLGKVNDTVATNNPNTGDGSNSGGRTTGGRTTGSGGRTTGSGGGRTGGTVANPSAANGAADSANGTVVNPVGSGGANPAGGSAAKPTGTQPPPKQSNSNSNQGNQE